MKGGPYACIQTNLLTLLFHFILTWFTGWHFLIPVQKAMLTIFFRRSFLKLIDCTTPFQSEEHRKAWLIRVTINCCNQLWRSAWRRRTVPLDHLPEESEETIFPQESALFCAYRNCLRKIVT